MNLPRAFFNSSKDHVVFLGGQKMCRKKQQKTAWISRNHMVRIQFMDFKKRLQFPHDQKKEAEEFQPWVKLHVFGFLPLVFIYFFQGSFDSTTGWLRKTLPQKNPENWWLGRRSFPFWKGIFSGGELLGFRRCIRKPNHWEFLQNASPARMQSSPLQWRITSYSRDAVLGLGEHSSISYLHFWI